MSQEEEFSLAHEYHKDETLYEIGGRFVPVSEETMKELVYAIVHSDAHLANRMLADLEYYKQKNCI